MLLPSSAILHAMAPLRPAQAPCRLRLTASDSAPFPPLRFGISGHRSSSHVRALLSAAPSPETLIPPLSSVYLDFPLMSPRTRVQPLSSLPFSSLGTRTSAAHGIGGGGDDDDDGWGQCGCGRVCTGVAGARARTTASAAACLGFRDSRDVVSPHFASGGRSAAVCVRVFRPDPFVEFLICSLVSFGRSILIWLARSRSIGGVFSAVFGRGVARKPPPLGARCLFSGFVSVACFSSLS